MSGQRVDLLRRSVVRGGAAMAATLVAGSRARAADPVTLHALGDMPQASRGVRRITLYNLHTDEHVDVDYWRDAAYVADALSAIDQVLRDFRSGERHPIDPHLMDYLYDLAASAGVAPHFRVISGYRSPRTNDELRERSAGVAQHSLHVQGRAIDVRLSGVDCVSLAIRAQALSRGGVGYYRKSDFVHLDTGAFRTWRG